MTVRNLDDIWKKCDKITDKEFTEYQKYSREFKAKIKIMSPLTLIEWKEKKDKGLLWTL